MIKNNIKKTFLLALLLLSIIWVKAQVVFVVQPPSELSGSYNMTWASPESGWGTNDLINPDYAVSGELVMALDSTSSDSLLCQTAINGDELVGKIAVLYRGSCEFAMKALNAQNAGAIGVVIVNHSGEPVVMGAGENGLSVTIPVIMISTSAGALLRPEIVAGGLNAYIGSNGVFNMLFWMTQEGIPFEDVEITINAETVTSAVDGSALFEGYVPSDYIFRASKFNYITQSGDLTIIDQDVEEYLAFTPLEFEIADSTFCYSTELTVIDDFAEYLWSTGDTTQTIIISEGGTYSVSVYDEAGFLSEGSINVPLQAEPYNDSQICMVTLDEELEKNVIVYEADYNVGIDSILFYHLNNITSEYELLGSNFINDSSVFIDLNSNPSQIYGQYKIAIKDTCGNISDLSFLHQTMLLQANLGVGGVVNLFWNAYEGFDYPNFGIYRSLDGGDYFLIANAPNNTYTYTDPTPPIGEKKYQIRVEKDTPCNPQSGFLMVENDFAYVGSNPVVLTTVGINELNVYNDIAIFPNPFNDSFEINRQNITEEIQVEVIDVYGRVIEIYAMKEGEESKSINTSNFQSGVYFIRFNGTVTKRIIKQ